MNDAQATRFLNIFRSQLEMLELSDDYKDEMFEVNIELEISGIPHLYEWSGSQFVKINSLL